MLEWWRRWRRERAAKGRKSRLRAARGGTELREFVYLDSTSVHSLVTSRLGPLAMEQTENEVREWESKAAVKAGADLAAFDLSASAERNRGGSQSIQVLKKSIIQTTFKDLLELEGDSLLLGAADVRKQRSGAAVPSSELLRGSLVELDVELDVEPVFRMATVVSSLVGFVERSPELFDAAIRKQFAEGRALEGMLSGLLGGLVPIRARVLNHVVVSDGGQLAVAQVDGPSNAGEQLFLVGVAEEQLFWRDIRRVLFSRGRYKVLARIAADGIRDSWTPIKLGHVLEQVVPGFSAQLASWDTLASSNEPAAKLRFVGPNLKEALYRFIELASERVDGRCSSERVNSARSYVESLENSTLAYEAWKSETAKVAEILLPAGQAQLTPDDLATLRETAKKSIRGREDIGMKPMGDLPERAEPRHFLDCEIVAIYW